MQYYPNQSIRILGIKDLTAKTNMCTASVYNKLNSRSVYFDREFPRPMKLGKSAVGWVENEVDAWLNSRDRKE